MLELERADGILGTLHSLGVLDVHEGQDDEGEGEHTHGKEQNRVHVLDEGVLGEGADQGAHQHGSQGTHEGVEGTADLDILVGTLAAQEFEHRVHHGVEHAHGEAGDEGAQQIDEEVGGKAGDSAAYADDAGEELDEHAQETDGDGDKSGFLITILGEHLAGRDTHDGVCQEVHHVTHHAPEVGAFDAGLHFPDIADRSGQVGHEGNHAEQENHSHDGNDAAVTFFRHSALCFYFC